MNSEYRLNDLEDWLADIVEKKLTPPDFIALVETSSYIKEIVSDLDVSFIHGIKIDTYDDEGNPVGLEVEAKELEDAEKLVSNTNSALTSVEMDLSGFSTEKWIQNANEAWVWSKRSERHFDWTKEWMVSADAHGKDTLNHWIYSIVKNGSLEKDAHHWIDEYQSNVQKKSDFNFNAWWYAFSNQVKEISSDQAIAWLNCLKEVSQDGRWKYSQKWNGPLSSVKDQMDGLVSSLVQREMWSDLNSKRTDFWLKMHSEYPLKIESINLGFLFESHPSFFNSNKFFDDFIKRVKVLKWESLFIEEPPLNRPIMPEFKQYNFSNKLSEWINECKKTKTFGWHCIKDAFNDNSPAPFEMKTLIAKISLTLSLQLSQSTNKNNFRI